MIKVTSARSLSSNGPVLFLWNLLSSCFEYGVTGQPVNFLLSFFKTEISLSSAFQLQLFLTGALYFNALRHDITFVILKQGFLFVNWPETHVQGTKLMNSLIVKV